MSILPTGASFKKSATIDLGSHQVFNRPQGVGWHTLHCLHLIVSDRTFSPFQKNNIMETNEWIHRQPSSALFSTTDHPYQHPSLKNCSREILRVFATWRTSSSPSSSPSTWSFILETHPDAGHVKSLFCQSNILQHSRFLWPPGYHQPSTG